MPKSLTISLIGLLVVAQTTFAGSFFMDVLNEISGDADREYIQEARRVEYMTRQTGQPFYPENVTLSEANREQLYQFSLGILADMQAARARAAQKQSAAAAKVSYHSSANAYKNELAAESVRLGILYFVNRDHNGTSFPNQEYLKLADARVYPIVYEQIINSVSTSEASNSDIIHLVNPLIKERTAEIFSAIENVDESKRLDAVKLVRLAVATSAAQQIILNQVWNESEPGIAAFGQKILQTGYDRYSSFLQQLSDMGADTRAIHKLAEVIAQRTRPSAQDIGSHFYFESKDVKRRWDLKVSSKKILTSNEVNRPGLECRRFYSVK